MAGKFGLGSKRPAKEKGKMDRRARGRALAIFYISAFSAVVVSAILLCIFVFFRVGTITVTGCSAYREEDILQICSIAEGDNLVLLETGSREEALEYRFPYIEQAEIRKHIPSSVEIILTETDTAFSVEREDGRYLYVSYAGKVLEIADSPAPDSAVVRGCVPTNEKPSTQLAFEEKSDSKLFAQISGQLEKNDLEGITEIDLRNRYDITMTYDNRIVFRFGNTNDLEFKAMFGISMLIKMQEDGTLKADTRGEIDLTVAAEKNKGFFRETLESDEVSQTDGIAGRDPAETEGDDTTQPEEDGTTQADADTTESDGTNAE